MNVVRPTSTWQNSVCMTNVLFALCPATRWWCHVYLLPCRGSAEHQHMQGGQGGIMLLPHFFVLLRDAYCSHSLVLCAAIGATSGLHTDWKKELEEKGTNKDTERGRLRDRRQTKRDKHFRKESHGTETRRPLKPADNPTDGFYHIRDVSESSSGREERVSAG